MRQVQVRLNEQFWFFAQTRIDLKAECHPVWGRSFRVQELLCCLIPDPFYPFQTSSWGVLQEIAEGCTDLAPAGHYQLYQGVGL